MANFSFGSQDGVKVKSGDRIAVPAWLLYGGLSLLLTLLAEHTRPRTVVITVPDPNGGE